MTSYMNSMSFQNEALMLSMLHDIPLLIKSMSRAMRLPRLTRRVQIISAIKKLARHVSFCLVFIRMRGARRRPVRVGSVPPSAVPPRPSAAASARRVALSPPRPAYSSGACWPCRLAACHCIPFLYDILRSAMIERRGKTPGGDVKRRTALARPTS